MSKKSDRKLAVILFADITGYTALMRENESLALDTLQTFKTIIHKKIPEYGGDVIQYFGDGCLIAFDSSTLGIRCALELQNSFHQQYSLPVRIGMHLGEVLFKEENVYGDGVNLASRIESIGVPGSVLFSKAIRDQIMNKKEFEILSLGSFDFKNINEPVEVFALNNNGLVVPDRRFITGKLNASKSSIFKRKDVQTILVFINLMIVALLSMWYFDANKQNTPITPYGNKYILAIGVDNNPNWLRLYNAKNDALGVAGVLQEYFGFQLLNDPLINEEATKDQIMKSIDRAKDVLQEDDQLMVFYAGHGYSDFSEGEDDPEGYIVPYDGPSEESGNPSGFIKISDFLKEVSDLPARHITTIFDACYSGFALQNQLIVSRGSSSNLEEASINPSRKVFSSADHNQIAADSGPIAEHSLFSGFLIEGLRTGRADRNSDEIISMNELAIYLENSIYDYSSSGQIPRYGNFLSDKGGEMLLQYDGDQLRKELTADDIIKSKNEIYTALPFRTSSTEDDFLELKTYLPEIILEALGEYDKGDYKIVNLNLLAETDSSSTYTPLNEYVKRSGVTKYFTGTFNLFDDKAVVKISLHNAQDASTIYTFPDIITDTKNNKIFELASLSKKYVKGFLDNTDQVMTRITNPPDYEAYKQLKRAYHHMRNDEFNNREKAIEFINKAIEIDPKYFRAHLAKVWSYIACHPVDVSKAKEEYAKLENIEFNISDYEEERLSLLFYEAVGDYPQLVKHKIRILRDYPNRSVFNDAMWYARATNDHSAAYEMIDIVEENELDADFRNDIFTWKNIIEYQREPIAAPIYYERFKRETELVKKRFKYFLKSKLLFDCEENCFQEVEKLIHQHSDPSNWNYFRQAAMITSYKNKEEVSQKFLKKAWDLYSQSDDQSFTENVSFQYDLKEYDKCILMTENVLDSLVSENDFSSIRYYILSKIQLEEKIPNKDSLISSFYTFKNRPGICYYYLATIRCTEGKFNEANKLLKMALENSIPFDYNTYRFDPDLKPMWDNPEFIAFTTPK